MQASEVVVRILEDEGITHAFGIPGAGINPVYKHLGTSDKIEHCTMRHEEAAVHAADAYYRACGKMALAICTSGPGATNFVTGMYTAQIDSIPLIAITGQAVSSFLGKDAFQCVDIAKICEPVAKATYCITDANDVPRVFREAFKTALEGRPGPVLIDLPLDIQKTDIDYDPEADKSIELKQFKPDETKISSAFDMLKKAEKPVMIMGGGVILSGAEKEFVKFAEMMQIPVITTYMAKGGIPVDHPLNAGHMGIQVGGPLGNKVFMDSDLVLGVGCRFTDRHTGSIDVYTKDKDFIHIDIDEKEINKIVKAKLGIVSDAKLAIEALIKVAEDKGVDKRDNQRVKELADLRESLERKTYFEDTPIKPQRIFYELNNVFDEDTMFTTGCGNVQIWSGQFQKINKPRKYMPSGGAGTLGFDIPAAIGASVAQGKKKTVAVMGDFGFTFLVEELAVAAKYEVPIVVVILNNAYLSLIRQNQKYAYDYEYAVAMKENHDLIDYVKVSEGLGCKAERVTKPEDIEAAFKRAAESNRPYVIDVVVERETDCAMGPSIDKVKEF